MYHPPEPCVSSVDIRRAQEWIEAFNTLVLFGGSPAYVSRLLENKVMLVCNCQSLLFTVQFPSGFHFTTQLQIIPVVATYSPGSEWAIPLIETTPQQTYRQET
jgi:hypothetical protein